MKVAMKVQKANCKMELRGKETEDVKIYIAESECCGKKAQTENAIMRRKHCNEIQPTSGNGQKKNQTEERKRRK